MSEDAASYGLAIPDAGPVVEYRRTALMFVDRPTWEQSESLVNTLFTMDRTINWWIGDAILMLEAVFPQNFAQLFPDGMDAKTLANKRWVASKIIPSRRREGLSWSHHDAVAGLDEAQQEEVLMAAELNSMSVAEVRKMVKALQGKVPKEKEPKVWHVTCPECGCQFEFSEDSQ